MADRHPAPAPSDLPEAEAPSRPDRTPDKDSGNRPGQIVAEELLARIADRSAKIAFLQEMTGALARAENLPELLDKMAEIAQRHLPYEVCSTHLVDPETGRITVVLGSGPLFQDIGTRGLKVGEGIVGWVVQNGQLANVPDVTRDVRYVASTHRIRSELAVPIRARGRTVGVFNLESSSPETFTAYDEQIFSILAAQIGASMERVDLYKEAVDRARRLESLNRIARAIAAPQGLEQIFQVVVEEVARLVPHDRTSLAIFDLEKGEMEVVGSSGNDPELGKGARFHPSPALQRSERPVLYEAADADPSVRGRLAAIGIERFVAVPIRLDGDFVAQLNLGWKGPARLPAGGLDFLAALGSHLAVVLKNARLDKKASASDAELQKAQDRLIQSAKLAAVGELAAGVAHELNNPLTGILGYTQWVLLEVSKHSEAGVSQEGLEPIRTRLQKIEREVQRCKEIVQNLLNFSRSHAAEDLITGSHKVMVERLRVNEVVESTLGVAEHQLGLSQVRVVRKLGERLPQVVGNFNQLQQVFTNIVINGAKAMPAGGTLTVETRARDGSVEVAFTDTGHGMSTVVKKRIFEPFFTTRKVGEGTGLGLSVSYGLVKTHGGEILVDSDEGKGATFVVRLPSAPD